MKKSQRSLLGMVPTSRAALASAWISAGLFLGCSHYEDHLQRDKVPVVVEIDTIPQGAEVFISRISSDAVPGESGGDWVAKGGFGFVGRTPLKVDDEIIRSTKSTRKTMSGGIVLYNATGASVFEENSRRIVLLKPGYKTIDVTEQIGSETRLRLQLVEAEGLDKDKEADKGLKVPTAQVGNLGKLSIVSVPSPADVEIDGRYIGETPAAVQLLPGPHQLLLRKPGHADWTRQIELLAGSDQKVTATLETAKSEKPETEVKSR